MNPVTNKGKNSDLDTTCTSTSSNDSGVRVSTLNHLSLEVLKKQFVNYSIVDERFTQKTPPETPPEMHQSETQPTQSCSKGVSGEDTETPPEMHQSETQPTQSCSKGVSGEDTETPPEMHQSETQPMPSCSKGVSGEDTETPPEMHQSETQPMPSCSKDVSCEDTKKTVAEATCISSSSYTVSSDFSGGETDGSEVDLFDTLESEGNMYGERLVDIYGPEVQEVCDEGIEVVSEEVPEVADGEEVQEVEVCDEGIEVVSEEVPEVAENRWRRYRRYRRCVMRG